MKLHRIHRLQSYLLLIFVLNATQSDSIFAHKSMDQTYARHALFSYKTTEKKGRGAINRTQTALLFYLFNHLF